jgi:hypothetical protein
MNLLALKLPRESVSGLLGIRPPLRIKALIKIDRIKRRRALQACICSIDDGGSGVPAG